MSSRLRYERRQILEPHYPHGVDDPCNGQCGGYSIAKEILVPVLTQLELDHNGSLRSIRVTEKPWGRYKVTEAPEDWRSVACEPATRERLIELGVLVPAHEWPLEPCLRLGEAWPVWRSMLDRPYDILNPDIEALFDQFPHLCPGLEK